MAVFMGIVFATLLFIGAPIGFTLGITALLCLLRLDNPVLLKLIPQRFFAGIDSFPLMAMPFFMLAGDIMNQSGITERLVGFTNTLVGHLRGGLAHVNILASVFFAGITGSAVADTAALGSILIPAMSEAGYSTPFSAAVTAASSVIGPIIPPSIIMVLYGSIMGVSIAGLFAAGVVPGLLFGLALMIPAGIISKKRDYPIGYKRATLGEIWASFKESFLALIMPILILGGILGGVFTPTEAAAVAVFYACLVGFFVFKTLKVQDLPRMLLHTSSVMGMIFLIMASASILGWLLASERIPELVSRLVLSISTNPHVVMLLINLFLLFVGMFMDIGAALVILAPILAPLAISVGVNPLHFGVIMTINLNIGLITPPLGACLFVACGISRLKLEDVVPDLWPFILAEVAILFLITYVPIIPMFLPKLLGFA
ncbi:MAG: TRAP transporter large permease [Limnochordia bacterium]|jgi:tripartite ATP-independent transporter DctM subunit